MGYAFMIIVGVINGWLTAFIVRMESRRSLFIYMGAGTAGALVAGLLIAPMVMPGSSGVGNYSVASLLIAMAGSLGCLVLTYLWHSRRLR